MVGIGSDLKMKAGPLPVWAWAGIGTAGVASYLIYKKKQSMNTANTTSDTQSNVVGAPSNLIPNAQPMPYTQGGDTFVDTTINNLPSPGNANAPCPQGLKRNADGSCPPILPHAPSPLPTVNPAGSPTSIPQNSAIGKTMIKIGCYDKNGHYTGHQVAGHVPVYALVAGFFKQGAPVHAKGAHCLFIPEKFKAYIQ